MSSNRNTTYNDDRRDRFRIRRDKRGRAVIYMPKKLELTLEHEAQLARADVWAKESKELNYVIGGPIPRYPFRQNRE